MDRGYIKLHRDMVDSGPNTLALNHKSTLLYIHIALNANHSGSDKGKLRTNINHLAYVIGASYHSTRRWLDELCNSKLLDIQKDHKDSWIITVRNYCRMSGNSKNDVNDLDMESKNGIKQRLDNEVISDSYKPLKNEELRIEKKEKKKNNIKRKKEKFGGRPEAVAAIAGDLSKFVAYAQSKSDEIDISPMWVEREFEKWSNWMDANNKTYSNYNKAFSNWILNAIAYQMERQPKRGTRLEDIPLLSADDYN